MPAQSSKLTDLVSALSDSREIADLTKRVWVYHGKIVVVDFENDGHRFALDLTYESDILVASVVGRTNSARRLLRNSLIGSYEMIKRDGERHLLGAVSDYNNVLDNIVLNCIRKLKIVDNLLRTQSQSGVQSPVEQDAINAFWWDGRANFGDVIGPWLAAKITQKTPVNGRARNLLPAPIMTVGSILNLVEQDGTIVWGSGLIRPLPASRVAQLKSVQDVSIRAVRGKLTRMELIEKLGWDVPEVYGDPALLLPRFLPVEVPLDGPKMTAVVPHYVHVDHFKTMSSDSINIVDVQDGMERVVRQIATAGVCISTSLHGLIIAQAYGVPWVWIRVSDEQLGGDTFKFNDFFSTLDSSAVSSLDVRSSDIAALDLEAIAQTASLPELQISLDDLHRAFPHEIGSGKSLGGDTRARKMESGLVKVGEVTVSDLMGSIDGLVGRLEALAAELADQRRLLELLATAR